MLAPMFPWQQCLANPDTLSARYNDKASSESAHQFASSLPLRLCFEYFLTIAVLYLSISESHHEYSTQAWPPPLTARRPSQSLSAYDHLQFERQHSLQNATTALCSWETDHWQLHQHQNSHKRVSGRSSKWWMKSACMLDLGRH